MSATPAPARAPVLVTGAGVVCAVAQSLDGFAAALREGRSGIGAMPGEAGTGPVLAAGLASDPVIGDDPRLPAELRRSAVRATVRAPLAIRAAVAAALQGWESAGLHRAPVPAGRIGLVVGGQNLGGAHTDRLRPRFASSPAHLPARYALQVLDTDHVGTVSEVLGIEGEGYTVGGASATGNVAIVNACRLIEVGAVDVCVVIGALAELSAMERQAYANLGAMAGFDGEAPPASRARPFDRDRAGFVPGQGAGCLVLESAASAHRRGARAAAAVLGYALRLDGNRLSDPDAAGEAWTMAEALRRSGVVPAAVDYVNAHGTGSRLGDETEVAALHDVFGPDLGRPWLNSTKGLIGHTLWAAGVLEAIATLVQMRDGFVHPNANLDHPMDPRCRFAGASAQPATVRVALSNGFGFGGFNTSVVLGAGPGRGG